MDIEGFDTDGIWETPELAATHNDLDNLEYGTREEQLEETTENMEEPELESCEDIPSYDNEIDYDEIYEQIQNDALRQGFEDMPIDRDEIRLDNALYHFEEENWNDQSFEEQKESMAELADYVSEVVGLDNPPSIDYYYNESEEYGAYDADRNVLRINEYMLGNAEEAADTVAHELWHAHQHECADNPQNARDYQYQYNFSNYVSPELDQDGYENQLIEAEARAFAAQFKERLALMGGRR